MYLKVPDTLATNLDDCLPAKLPLNGDHADAQKTDADISILNEWNEGAEESVAMRPRSPNITDRHERQD